MKDDKTLQEICIAIGVTRRAVQGYEKAGLVKPVGKNKYGYLLYDQLAKKRITQIKQYQDYGFTIKEIEKIIDADDVTKLRSLKAQLLKLRQNREKIEMAIKDIEKIIKTIK